MIPKFRARDQRGNWHIGLLTFMFGQYAIVNEADENTVYLIDKETVGQSTGLKGYMSDSYKKMKKKMFLKATSLIFFWKSGRWDITKKIIWLV